MQQQAWQCTSEGPLWTRLGFQHRSTNPHLRGEPYGSEVTRLAKYPLCNTKVKY